MAMTLEKFQEKYGIAFKQMEIEPGVSIYPRTILVPKCPECGGTLYLYHPEKKIDPFIWYKITDGILKDKLIIISGWIVTCWTDNCDFFLEFDEDELAQCPECNRFTLELYSLYDHMRFQCSRKAQDRETLKKAGCDMYIGDLM